MSVEYRKNQSITDIATALIDAVNSAENANSTNCVIPKSELVYYAQKLQGIVHDLRYQAKQTEILAQDLTRSRLAEEN